MLQEDEGSITYITPEGVRIDGKNNLSPHIRHLENITEENFTFQPIELPIKDPLRKYQCIRSIPGHRSTSRATPRWLHQITCGDNTIQSTQGNVTNRRDINFKRPMKIEIDNRIPPRKTPWQIEYAIQRRPRAYKGTKQVPRFMVLKATPAREQRAMDRIGTTTT